MVKRKQGTYNEFHTVAVTVLHVDMRCTFLYMSRMYLQWFVNIHKILQM